MSQKKTSKKITKKGAEGPKKRAPKKQSQAPVRPAATGLSDAEVAQLKAAYYDAECITPQKLFRTEIGGYRFYYTEGNKKFIPSVTTIIEKYAPMSPYLLKWYCDLGMEGAKRYIQERAHYGTFLHILHSDVMLVQSVDISDYGLFERFRAYLSSVNDDSIPDALIRKWVPDLKKDVIGFVKWCQDYNPEPMAVELTMAGDYEAGTIDFAGYITIPGNKKSKAGKRIFCIVDFKSRTGVFYPDHVVQLVAYRDIWDKVFKDFKVEAIFNLGTKNYNLPIGKTVTPYNFKRWSDEEITAAKVNWLCYRNMWYANNPATRPEKKIVIDCNSITRHTDVDKIIKEVDPFPVAEDDPNSKVEAF